MPDGQVLEFDRVTKRFGEVTAVSEFSGRVEPGVVTGFLGPNGAGKTTTLRVLLGQLRPSSGSATIGGAQYSELKHPARVIGAMHEDPGFRPRRTVERHLITAAKANGIALSRVGEVIDFVGLGGEAGSRIGTLSLGMRQRLSAATALLGDPGALVLDEPANGLDPEGIRWMRLLIRGLADEGRTVLVSSHVLSEVEQVADDILVIARGQRKFAGSLSGLADPSAGPVVVDSADRAALTTALTAAGFEFEVLRSGLTVRGSDAATIGAVAAQAGVALTTLQQRGPTLEDVFLDVVNDRPVQVREPDAPTSTASDAEDAEPVVADAASVVALSDPGSERTDPGAENAALSDPGAENADARAEERPLPGLAGLAAVAAGLAGPAAPAEEVEALVTTADDEGGRGDAAGDALDDGTADAAGAAEESSALDGHETVAETADESGESGTADAGGDAAESASAFAVATTGVIDAVPEVRDDPAAGDADVASDEIAAIDDATAAEDASAPEWSPVPAWTPAPDSTPGHVETGESAGTQPGPEQDVQTVPDEESQGDGFPSEHEQPRHDDADRPSGEQSPDDRSERPGDQVVSATAEPTETFFAAFQGTPDDDENRDEQR